MKVSAEALERMKAHALETYPDECCGVVIAKRGGGRAVVRIRNIQDEMHAQDQQRYPRTARIAYSGDPADLKAALDLAEAPGNRLFAFYHSHPDHTAYFSDEDIAQATPLGEPSYPEALQIVISVYGPDVREVKAFAWSVTRSTFEEVSLEPR